MAKEDQSGSILTLLCIHSVDTTQEERVYLAIIYIAFEQDNTDVSLRLLTLKSFCDTGAAPDMTVSCKFWNQDYSSSHPNKG
jgi:hypothetical protein